MFRTARKLAIVVLILSLSLAGAAHAAIIDSALAAKLSTAAPAELLSVIVTYNAQPAAADLTRLRVAGVRFGVSLKELPMAGVWATAAQINQIAGAPNVRSIYLNKSLRYFN